VLGDLLNSVEETAPCRARERTADADPTNAERGQFLNRRKVAADQYVHRLRCHGADHGRDLWLGTALATLLLPALAALLPLGATYMMIGTREARIV